MPVISNRISRFKSRANGKHGLRKNFCAFAVGLISVILCEKIKSKKAKQKTVIRSITKTIYGDVSCALHYLMTLCARGSPIP